MNNFATRKQLNHKQKNRGIFVINDNKKTPMTRNHGRKKQGHQGSNSGHAVLETAALPAELYP